jgi:XTP/dITP diphosphohydrolase
MAGKLRAGDKIVVASHNAGKVREIEALLAPLGIETVAASELGLAEPEETGATFAENAVIKAVAAAEAANMPALADDSGLEVEALGGAPGIHSARWAGESKNFRRAMSRIARELAEAGAVSNEPNRANFTCVLAIAWPHERVHLFEGKVFGHLVWPPRGEHGFGYDPIFVADDHEETFGEMEPAQKHAISHRAKAFEQFVAEIVEGRQ